MRRVIHHLSEDQIARLRDLASRLGITAAELIRRALDREIAANLSLLETPENPRMATAKTARRATLSEAQKYIIEASRLGRVSEVQRIALDKITDDHTYQSREKIDKNYIHSELRPLLEQYGDLEPIVLFKEYGSERLFIGNGFHRYELYKMARRPDIPCIIIDAGEDWERELRLYSASANLKFSKPPTKEDKAKALRMLFEDKECWTWGDKDLSRRSGVPDTRTTVLRKQFSDETGKPIPSHVKVFRSDGTFRWFPYKRTELTMPMVNKVHSRGNVYQFQYKGHRVRFRADTPEEAQEKAAQKAVSIQAKTVSERVHRTSLLPAGLCPWLTRRKVSSAQVGAMGSHGLSSSLFLAAPCHHATGSAIGFAVSQLLYLWKREGFPAKELVIVCYSEDWNQNMISTIMETLSAPGLFQIHFLTPEEIVQRYAPQEGQADQGGNGFH